MSVWTNKRGGMRAAITLGRHRVATRLGARVGMAAAVGIALVYGFAASSGVDLAADSNRGLVAGCLRWAAWLGAGPVALSLAREDEARGLSELARLAGIDAATSTMGRTLGAAITMATLVAAPALLVCVAGAVRTPSLGWARLAVGAAVAAALIGAVLAAVAIVCRELAPERGRSLLAAVVILPYLAAQGAIEGWSLPGLLGAAIAALTGGAR